jgi:hypothetical protein
MDEDRPDGPVDVLNERGSFRRERFSRHRTGQQPAERDSRAGADQGRREQEHTQERE